MHISDVRLDALSQALSAQKLDLFLVPMVDEFQSEYTPESAKRLPWLTGFDGSAGLGVCFAQPNDTTKHTLFTDGRYTLQAAAQVSARVQLHNSGEMPFTYWLSQLRDVTIGFDPWLTTQSQLMQWLEATHGNDVEWVATSPNPIDSIWSDRPAAPMGEVIKHPLERAGASYFEKRDRMMQAMEQAGAKALILPLPDGINWLLNIRGSDVEFNPLLLCYFMLESSGRGTLFSNKHTFNEYVDNYLADQQIAIRPLSDIFDAQTAQASAFPPRASRILIDPTEAAHGWWQLAEMFGWELIEANDPTQLPKACKNAVELQGIRAAHQRDGLALTKFLAWFDGQIHHKHFPTELDIVEKLEAFRRAAPEYRGASFATIAGSGPNGAIVHYRVDATSNRRLGLGELFLLDSGGQYVDGTTDVTRTISVGPPSAAMREHFTRVLKGHIALASVRFPVGTTGQQLDVLARQHLWAVGLDYDHGTGHGVGAYLSVHEGPQRISKRGSNVPLQPGMVISNEPGYYKAGAYGIRIESLVTVVSDAQGMLGFETLTLAPIDTRLIALPLLNMDEHNWLNAYHRRVYDTHAPYLSEAERSWLEHATRAI